MSNWNDERVALLKKLWAEGHSCSMIAARLKGVTRNAVIGKVTRLGLSGRTHVTVKRKPVQSKKYAGPSFVAQVTPKPKKPVQWKNPFVPGGPAGAEKKPVEPYQEPPAPFIPPAAQLVAMNDLEPHHCKFPIGDPRSADFKFCGGNRALGLPYCEAHVRVAYRGPDMPQERSGEAPQQAGRVAEVVDA